MAQTLKVGTPVYWVQDVYNSSLLVDELNRRRGPTKELKTARITLDRDVYSIPEGTILTPISEEDYNGLESGNINVDGLKRKYPVQTRGGRKRRTNKTRRYRK
jgi:hypothetical protein